MSLTPLDDLWPILRCPICRGSLTPTPAGATCDGAAGGPRHAFSKVGAHPVLVDFADSVLRAEDVRSSSASSLVPRWGAGAPAVGAVVNRVGHPFAPDHVSGRSLERLRKENPRPRILVVGGGTAGDSVRELYQAAD